MTGFIDTLAGKKRKRKKISMSIMKRAGSFQGSSFVNKLGLILKRLVIHEG